MKFIIFFICVTLPFVYSELHSFITTYTEINGQTAAGTPEFSAVTTLDGHQIDYYDSNIKKLIPRQYWMKEFASKELWKEDTEIREDVQQIYRNNIHVLMQRFNQSHGVHTYQRMYGCDWDDQTGDSHGFDQYGYDGEDFISLDLKENRYISSVPLSLPTAMKWNNNRAQLIFLKQYYDHECVHWLKELLKLRKEAYRITAPEVSLLRKDPSSPVECHATGFYPSGVSITWLRNGLEHHEDVDLGELLPNEDGTFQKTSSLHVSPDELENNKFTCEVEHQGKPYPDPSPPRHPRPITIDYYEWYNELYLILLCVMGGVIVLAIGTVLYIKYKKPKHEPVPNESEGQNRIDKSL